MSILLHGDCLEEMKGLDDNSVDLIFCDLPYGQTSCKWDCCIDLEAFWVEIMRIKKLNTPLFFTTTTKFGVSLIQSAPKKCPFRYDLVWVKSAPAGFLSAKKMPMRKHEMIYVFYEKLPFYDLSSHKHRFIKDNRKSHPTDNIYSVPIHPDGLCGKYDPPLPVSVVNKKDLYGIESGNAGRAKGFHQTQYDPPLPVSVVKETYKGIYSTLPKTGSGKDAHSSQYDPPLPVSVVKEQGCYGEKVPNSEAKYGQKCSRQYDPPLPVSVVKEDACYGSAGSVSYKGKHNEENGMKLNQGGQKYTPPLPVSVVKESGEYEHPTLGVKIKDMDYQHLKGKMGNPVYEPPLPNSMLEIKSTRGKHSTEKPVALMEWVLKYYSKEGDVVLDPTMGSGSTGVACKNMNRNFIGIEKDDEIYEVACNRIYD